MLWTNADRSPRNDREVKLPHNYFVIIVGYKGKTNHTVA